MFLKTFHHILLILERVVGEVLGSNISITVDGLGSSHHQSVVSEGLKQMELKPTFNKDILPPNLQKIVQDWE